MLAVKNPGEAPGSLAAAITTGTAQILTNALFMRP
jgi:hypothetical protein